MWVYYALFYALWNAISNVYVKKLTQNIPPLHVTILLAVFSLPFMIPLILITGGFPHITLQLILLMSVSALLDTFAFAAAYQAIKTSPLSLISPIAAFSPALTTFIAFIFLKESPNLLKIIGILLVVMGLYVLNIADAKKGYFAPIINLFKNRGVQLFFFAFILWSITPILQKAALAEMTPHVPLFASFIGYIFVIIFMLFASFITKQKLKTKYVKKHMTLLIILGATIALAQYAAYTAFSLAPVGYAVSIFRLSTLFTVVAGGLFFKEKNLVSRFLGAAIMVGGAILLAF